MSVGVEYANFNDPVTYIQMETTSSTLVSVSDQTGGRVRWCTSPAIPGIGAESVLNNISVDSIVDLTGVGENQGTIRIPRL